MPEDEGGRNALIWQMHANGASRRQISNTLGVPMGSVAYVVRVTRERGRVPPKRPSNAERNAAILLRLARGESCSAVATVLGVSSDLVAGVRWRAALPRNRRAAIILLRGHGVKCRQIAAALGCTVGAVAGLMDRARGRGQAPNLTPRASGRAASAAHARSQIAELLAQADRLISDDACPSGNSHNGYAQAPDRATG